MEIEKSFEYGTLRFINAMVELNKYLEDSSRMCEEAMAHTKLRVSEDTKEVAKISSLGTEWATKLDRWMQLHPEASRGPIPPLEEKEANSPSRIRRRRYTIVSLPQN